MDRMDEKSPRYAPIDRSPSPTEESSRRSSSRRKPLLVALTLLCLPLAILFLSSSSVDFSAVLGHSKTSPMRTWCSSLRSALDKAVSNSFTGGERAAATAGALTVTVTNEEDLPRISSLERQSHTAHRTFTHESLVGARLDRRQPQASPATSPTPTTSSITVPTVPGSSPVLPTPFPQPWDNGLSSNFSSVTCQNFFTNMTQSTSFRTCRPFGLLIQSSDGFTEAQNNLTLMNNIVWGTCNTATDETTCAANMGFFAATLQNACKTEIKNGNQMVINAYQGLESYSVMHDAGCLVDANTGSYCYVEAVASSNPSDSYLYSLPVSGLPYPTTGSLAGFGGLSAAASGAGVSPSCSSCAKSLFQLYSYSLSSQGNSGGLQFLNKYYDAAAKLYDTTCGAEYAPVINATQTATSRSAGVLSASNPLSSALTLVVAFGLAAVAAL